MQSVFSYDCTSQQVGLHVRAIAPNNQDWTPAKQPQLPNCFVVGATNAIQAYADTYGEITDAAGLVAGMASQALTNGSNYYGYRAAVYSASAINTLGGVGLLVPLRSSIYRGLLATSDALAEAAAVPTAALLYYNLGKQLVNEIKNPTPCKRF